MKKEAIARIDLSKFVKSKTDVPITSYTGSAGGGGSSGNSDTVDGLHATNAPVPFYLLSLDISGEFPLSVIKWADVAGTGLAVTGDLLYIDLKTVSGLEADTAGLAIADSLAGAGLSITNKVLSINYSGTTPVALVPDVYGNVGVSSYAARSDHRHNVDTEAPSSDSVGVAVSSEGIASHFSRSDHYHNLDENMTPTWTNTHTWKDTTKTYASLTIDKYGVLTFSNAGAATPDAQWSYNGSNLRTNKTILIEGGSLFINTTTLSDVAGTLYTPNSFNVAGSLRVSANETWLNAGVPTGEAALKAKSSNTGEVSTIVQKIPNQLADLFRIEDTDGGAFVHVTKDGIMQSGKPGFVSGLTGWSLGPNGDMEVNNLTARGEFHSSLFVYDEIHANGGTIAVMSAFPVAYGSDVIPELDANFDIVIKAKADGTLGLGDGDVLRLKFLSGKPVL